MPQIGLLIIFALLASCSMVERVALKTTGSLISKGSDEILTEGHFDNFVQGAPANLKLIEGLWFSDKENKELLTMLIKGYAAYGFAAMETKALDDILLEKEKSEKIEKALLYYQKAINYGEYYLKVSGIKPEQFWDKAFPEQLAKRFSASFNDKDYVALFYFAQALGSSINLQRTNVAKMAFMNHVQKTFEWVCAKQPELERGSCHLFDALFLASLPSIMGGSQDKAREKFLQIMQKQPYNLLAHMSFIQFHLVPMMEEEEFDKEMAKLNKNIQSWYQLQLGNKSTENQIFQKHPEFNLFNSIARERYFIFKKLKKEIL